MDWLQINILTTPEGMEIVTGLFDAHGLSQTEWVESAAQVQAALDARRDEWDYIDASALVSHPPCVRAYVRNDDSGADTIRQLGAALEPLRGSMPDIDLGPLTMQVIPMREEDWANNWKQYFRPFALGERLYIRPPWEKTDAPQGRVALTIDPGMLFGTGAHPTTQLSLLALEKAVAGGMRVLDLGCGSGILSIASLLLGASEVTGVDIDTHAPRTVLDNARHSGVDPASLHIHAANILTDTALLDSLAQNPFDLIVANIVADVILELIPLAANILRPGGALIVSGIIDERLQEVDDALSANGYLDIEAASQGDWRLLRARHA